MKSDERFIRETFGRQRPFRVPAGYFDDFVSRMDSLLPDKKRGARVIPVSGFHRPAKQVWLKVAAAACVCGLLFGGAMFVGSMRNTAPLQSVDVAHNAQVSSSTVSAVDYVADYAMLDNSDIYAYVSSN